MSWQLGGVRDPRARARRRLCLVRAARPTRGSSRWSATLAAFAALGRIAFAARAERQADDRHRADLRLRARRRAGVRGRRDGGADLELLLRPGSVDAVADGRPGASTGRSLGAGARARSARGGRIGRWPLAAASCVVRPGSPSPRCRTSATGSPTATTASRSSASTWARGSGSTRSTPPAAWSSRSRFGPALLRSIQRFAQRLQVTWLPPAPAGPMVAIVLVGGGRWRRACATSTARARPPRRRGPRSRTCSRAQNADGGFGAAPGQASNALYSRLGGARPGVRRLQPSAGVDAAARACSPTSRAAGARGPTPARSSARSSSRAAGLRRRASAAGPGRDARARRRAPTARFGDQVNLTSFAVLALRAAGVAPPAHTFAG